MLTYPARTSIVRTVSIQILRWIIASPKQRRRGPFWRWSSRAIISALVVWLFAFGPAGMLAPRLFGFSVASTGDVRIYYQNQVPQQHLIHEVTIGAQHARQRNLAFWGEPKGGVGPIDIYLCNSRSRWLQMTFGGGSGNACAIGSSIVMSPLSMPGQINMDAVITHEMSHVFLYQRIGMLKALRVPAWINEGIATYIGQNFWASDESIRSVLEKMASPHLVMANDLASRYGWLNAFTDSDGAADGAVLTYGHARGLCDYLISHDGPDRMKTYLSELGWLRDSGTMFKAVFGTNVGQADQAWLVQQKSLGLIPMGTFLSHRPFHWQIMTWFTLAYGLLGIAFLWLVRQCFRFGRFIGRFC